MAIVEGKSGMQIGNMPSIDAVTQDGFIIYSDDGIHTYKMTIAEFAQAIGVVMTGGGDGDGGDGLAYWKEESRRIFRDIIDQAEYDDKKITVDMGIAYAYAIMSCAQKGRVGVTNQYGYSATFGNHWPGWVDDDDWKINMPTYTDGEGNWTNPIYPFYKYLEVVNAIATIRYPALNDSLAQPDSRYYCNLLNKNALLSRPYSQLNTQLTFEDIVINPLCKYSQVGVDGQGNPGTGPEGIVTLEWDRIGALGQDRTYFGTINLNVSDTIRPYNPPMAADGQVYGISTENWYDTREEAEADLAAHKAAFEDMTWDGECYPKSGTHEYYFTLYCLGNPSTKGQAMLTHDVQHLTPAKEVNYYPWTIGRDHGFMHQYEAYYGGVHDSSFMGDFYNTSDESIYDTPPSSHLSIEIGARYINNLCYKDQNTGFIFPSPYIHVTHGHGTAPTPEYYDENDPFVYDSGWGSTVRHYSEAFQSNVVPYYDKADFGGAYFTDDEGTLWYVMLTGATRKSKSLWYDAWGNNRTGVNVGTIVSSVPTEFDKFPSSLNIPTMDHWCLDGVADSSEYDGLDNNNNGIYTTQVIEHSFEDPDTHEVTYKYGGTIKHTVTSLKPSFMQAAYGRLQNIGRAILDGLGLKGIQPLWPTDAIGIHSEIAANSNTALNGGIYKNNNAYEETYNLDAINGSLYLKGDAYDNGEKIKDAYQKKLIAGENIDITDDENGHPVISSTGGGGGGATITCDNDTYKNAFILGLGDRAIMTSAKNGIYFVAEAVRSAEHGDAIRLTPYIQFQSMNNTLTYTPESSGGGGSNTKMYMDIKQEYRESTQRVLMGGQHVWLYNINQGGGKNQQGHTPSGSNTASNRSPDLLMTDCLDAVKIAGTALTVQHDTTNKSYYVDIPANRVLPTVTAADAGKVLTVDSNGNWVLDYPSNL